MAAAYWGSVDEDELERAQRELEELGMRRPVSREAAVQLQQYRERCVRGIEALRDRIAR